MRYRVERVRTDHGYGPGWVVLDDEGTLRGEWLIWDHAMLWVDSLGNLGGAA